MIFLDTETCGLTGPIVLIQWAEDDGPVILHEVWYEPIQNTLRLLEKICNDSVCCFNLSFDWFHINKLYNLLRVQEDKSRVPEIAAIAEASHRGNTQYCLRPEAGLDLLSYARRSKWQCLMDRRPIRIRKIPIGITASVARMLEENLPLEPIFFYRRSKGYEWEIEPKGDGFADIVLKFAASSGLKSLVSEIFKIRTLDYPVPKQYYPEENAYNPYTTGWASVIKYHIDFWHSNKNARSYAEQDVIHLQRLWKHWQCPTPGDVDSELCCAVGAIRWAGYDIDIKGIGTQLEKANAIVESCPVNTAAHHNVKYWLGHDLPMDQKAAIVDTKEETLDILERVYKGELLAERAKVIIKARHAAKELDLYIKLLDAGSFNPDFKVIGARTGRMSGGSLGFGGKGSINPQGIQKQKRIRELFTLASQSEGLSGGDFKAFEIVISAAASGDDNLARSITGSEKFFGVLGSFLYDESYQSIISSAGTDQDFYSPAKNTGYAYFFGSTPKTMATTARVEEARAETAYQDLSKKYPEYTEFRKHIHNRFCSMQQPGGLGTQIIWKEPAEYIETLLGFRRYFTLENKVTRAIVELAQSMNLPKVDGLVTRRKARGSQTVTGATRSALYACAFQIQAQCMRAASNHVIQGTGAYVCKELQLWIWKQQPRGIAPWIVKPMNIHDEVITTHRRDLSYAIEDTAKVVVEKFKGILPLLDIDWHKNIVNWGDLK